MSRSGHARDVERLLHEELQPLTWRLLARDVVPGLVILVVLLAVGDPVRAVMVGGGVMLVSHAAFTGRHRRRLEVTDRAIRLAPAIVPLADVVAVEPADRRTFARIETEDFHTVLLGPGSADGVVLHRRTPEGIEHRVLVVSRDPERLAGVIERARHRADRPALATTSRHLPFRGRQGLDPLLAGAPFVVTLALDATSVAVFGQTPVFTPLWAVLVGATGLRRVAVDEEQVRVGRRRFDAHELASVRVVSRAESLTVPAQSLRRPLWGPPYALVLLVREGGRWSGDPAHRSVHLGVPRPLDTDPLRRRITARG